MKKYLAAVLALLILMGLTGCAEPEAETVPELLEPVGVHMDVAEAKIDTVFKAVTYSAEIVPYVEELQFLADGVLEEIKVSLGESVTEGQVLATLSEESIREQINALDAEMADIRKMGDFSDRQMKLDIEIARIELKSLQESGASDRDCRLKEVDIEKLETKLEQAGELRQLELKEKQRQRDSLSAKLGNNQITAPFAGRIVYISSVSSGASVQGYTTVLCIADESRLSLETDYIAESAITEADRVYAKVADKEYGVAYVPCDGDEYISLLLRGEKVKTRFSLDAPEGQIQSGQFAVLTLLNAYKEDTLTIPVNALYQDASGKYVYRMADGQRVRCDVTVGTVTDTKAEILGGLEEGDLVYVKE